MEIEKIFNDLESNQMQECEEAKKKLVDLIMQSKCLTIFKECVYILICIVLF